MSKYYYDFHIHSCLSPCADDDMTPANIAGMASIAGLNIVALTDHNTCKNCPAFFANAKQCGIIPIAGMELTTQEDIHIVCLFEHLDQALEFGEAVNKRRILIKNRPDIFGNQYITDADENIIGTEGYLLSNATELDLYSAVKLVDEFSGICFPAHIDRQANGLIAVLGSFPEYPTFKHAEFHDLSKSEEYKAAHPCLTNMMLLSGSDAHYLWDIRDKEHYFEIDDEEYSSALIRQRLFKILRGF